MPKNLLTRRGAVRGLTRAVAAGSLAAVIGLATAPAAIGWRNPEVKRVKRALVAIQEHIDKHRARYHSIMDRSELTTALIEDARLVLGGDGDDSTGLVEVIAQFGRLGRALHDRDALIRRLAAGKEQTRRLVARRTALIRELGQLVRESRIRNREFSPSWSVNGTLITYSADWQAVAMCESSGRWGVDSKYDGGLQFHPATWIGFGGGQFARYAHQATKLQQIAVAERVLAIQGERAWPNCFRHLPVDWDL
jgi:Transglycosylase-like domain